jgi:signal transduction histidine kinase
MARFSEVEILSHGVNMAKNKTVQASPLYHPDNPPSRLTDGKNKLGDILPLRDWINQLARRHDLETERPKIITELNHRYALQKRNLNLMSWLATILGAGTIIVVLIERNIRQRAVFRTRELIAANLHDELGASLHAVGLYGKLAKQQVGGDKENIAWDKLVKYIDLINTLTGRAAKTARFCTNMLEEKELYENPAEEMKRTAKQILADLEHELSFTGEEMLKALHPRRRVGVLLYYKECLTNIIRHSGATRVKTRLDADRKKICLTVQDNGKGVDATPPSLKRRTRLLKARLSVEPCAEGGTRTTLSLKIPGCSLRKKIQ